MRDDKRNLYILLIICIMILGTLISLFFFKGVSVYGDDFDYPEFAPQILAGTFSESLDIFSIRLLMDYPLALFIGLLGYNNAGAAAYTLLCSIATIPIIYLIGASTKDRNAGVISAALFSFYPLILKFNTSDSPMAPLLFFLSASLLLFIYGKKKNNAKYFFAAGAANFLGALINPLAFLYSLFFGLYIVYSEFSRLLHHKKLDLKLLVFFIGFFAAVNLTGFVNIFLANGNPYYELFFTNYYYQAAGNPYEIFYTNPSLTFYIGGYFPYHFTSIASSMLTLNFESASRQAAATFTSIFSISQLNVNDVGLFPYAMLLAGVYVAAKKDKNTFFILGAAVFLVLYMEFGTMSITHYFPIYKLMRFTVIASVPEICVLGYALSDLIKAPRDKEIGIIAVFLVLALLLVTSLPIDYYYQQLNYNTMVYIRLMASSLMPSISANPQNATYIYGPALIPYYLIYYLGYPKNVFYFEYGTGAYGSTYIQNCTSIKNNSYVIIPSQEAMAQINSYDLWDVNESWAFNPGSCTSLKLYKNIYAEYQNPNPYAQNLENSGNIYYKR